MMQLCENCKVSIKGNKNVCPLCGGILEGEGDQREEVFPFVPTIYQEFNLFIRILILLSIAAVAISFAVNTIFNSESRWSLLVAAGIACMWISLFNILRKRSNIPKTIVWQVGLISIFSVVWDISFGWYGWSLDYVIPSICVIAMIVMAIAAKIRKISVRDLVVYLFVDGIFGFIPILFILIGQLNVIIPSIICAVVSAISLSAILLFEGDNILLELKKRMHV